MNKGAKLLGFDEAIATLKRKVSAPKREEVLEAIGQMMVDETVKRIKKNQVKPSTTEKTLKARRKRKTPVSKNKTTGRTLADTGALLQSIRYRVDNNGTRLRVGTNKVYAAIQQYGGRTGRNKSVRLPARPYLYWTSVNKIRIRRMIRKVVENA